MSNLRRKGSNTNAKESSSKKETSNASAPSDFRRSGFSIRIIGLTLLLSSVVFLASRVKDTKTTLLPSSYAICSEEQNIYTVDEKNPRVECCVVSDGRITDLGSFREISNRQGVENLFSTITNFVRSSKRGLKVYYLKPGSILTPGFADPHGHVLEYGFKQRLNLERSRSVTEIVRRVRMFIESNAEIMNDTNAWVEGFGWDQNLWSPDGHFPTALDLDRDPVLRGRPIALTRIDGHASWVSPTVLKSMGRLPDTIEGGNIVRDEDGNPTGIFIDNARKLIPSPEWSADVMKRYLATTVKDAVAHGLTSIHDAGTSPEQIRFFQKMADENMLPIRLYVMGRIPSNEYWGDKIPRMEGHGNGRLTVKSVKLVSDGALGSWGAAMIEPYSDNPEDKGLLLTPPDILSSQIRKFFQDGWQVNVHCIGDKANENVLNIFEDVLQSYNASLVRPRIEHAQILQPSDLDRIGKLGVIPSVQPTHATSDMSFAELRIGSQRMEGAYAYQTLLQKSWGNILPIGSDFPIESIDPLKGFYAAVTRLTPDGTSPHGPGGWYPKEKLSRMQALKGMTYDAAYAAFSENEFGSIKLGLRADLVVLDTDIMTVPENQILNARARSTIVDGALVFGELA